MKTKTVNLYEFHELDYTAKEKAREWYRQGALDYEWWDCTLDDFHSIATKLGFEIDTPRHGTGKAIYFTGFCSQGDGACFAGNWKAERFSLSKMTEYLGDLDKHPDTELVRITKEFQALAQEHPTLYGSVEHTGRYCHAHSTSISCEEWTDTEEDEEDTCTAETEEGFAELARDLMDWLYKTLESEHDWLLADEQVDESIMSNGYTFTEDGERED